jgi:c-di-GMP-related signal transduction protein
MARCADAVEGEAGSMRYVARQPILDARGNVHGYEMLFRAGPAAAFSGDGDAATRDVLDNLVAGGIERLAGEELVFVNCTREALLGRLVMVLPPRQTVLELLETLEPTAELLKACLELKAAGFRLALDDFEWKPEWEPFLRIADYVKVDISARRSAGFGAGERVGKARRCVDLQVAAHRQFGDVWGEPDGDVDRGRADHHWG